jgi:hypothetical protein
MVGFYSKFIPGFSPLVDPLNQLKKKNAKFVWGPCQQDSFHTLKRAMCTASVLKIPDFSKLFV